MIKRSHRILKHTFIPFEGNTYSPHFFRGITVGALIGVGVLLFGISLGNSHFLHNTVRGTSLTASAIIGETNDLRILSGSLPLTRSDALDYAAELKARDMITHGYFAHESPTGTTPWYWLNQAGYVFTYAGENLAVNFQNSKDVGKAWFNSPKHRENLLNTNFQEIGVAAMGGVYKNAPAIFIVEMFGSPGISIASNSSSADTPEITKLIENEELIVIKNEKTIQGSALSLEKLNQETHLASWYNKILINGTHYIEILYKILLTVIILALLLMIAIETKKQHKKHILYGIFLLVTISILLYLHHILLISVKI